MHIVEIILTFFITVGNGQTQIVNYPVVFDKVNNCEVVAEKLKPVYLSNISSNDDAKVVHVCTVVKDIYEDVRDEYGCVSCYKTAIKGGFFPDKMKGSQSNPQQAIQEAVEALNKKDVLE